MWIDPNVMWTAAYSLASSVYIFSNQIGPGGAQLLADYIRSGCCALEELNLAGNRLTDEGGIALAEALQVAAENCPLRRYFTLHPAEISYLILSPKP